MKPRMSPQNRRIWLYFYTAAAVTITIGGTLYGAELATKQEKKKIIQKDHEASFDEKLAVLRSAREDLVSKKVTVEKQLRELEQKIAEKARKGVSSVTNDSQSGHPPK